MTDEIGSTIGAATADDEHPLGERNDADRRRPFAIEETVPIGGSQDEDDASTFGAAEAADLKRPALDDDPLSGWQFLAEDTVPLRKSSEPREVEERDARLRLLVPGRRFRRFERRWGRASQGPRG